jgi:hypothetical protein
MLSVIIQSAFKEFRVMPDDTEVIAQFNAVRTLNIYYYSVDLLNITLDGTHAASAAVANQHVTT